MANTDSLFKLRLPDYLREKLEKEALKKRRSLTAEILNRLEESFSNDSNQILELTERIATLEKAVFYKKEPEHPKEEYPITKYRKLHGLSIQELAEKIGIDRSYLGRIEKHHRLPTMDLVIKICEVLNLPLDTFLYELQNYRQKHKNDT